VTLGVSAADVKATPTHDAPEAAIDWGYVDQFKRGCSAGGSFGLSFGLAFTGGIMLATLSASFTHMANASTVLSPREKTQVATTLEHDAEVMSNAALQQQLRGRPPAVQDEILQINTDARHRALRVALHVPLIAAVLGFLNPFRMLREPEPEPSSAAEGMMLG
jgi:hypothetical protein